MGFICLSKTTWDYRPQFSPNGTIVAVANYAPEMLP